MAEDNIDFFDGYVPGLGSPPPETFMDPGEANEKALYAIGSKNINEILGPGYNFVQDLQEYSQNLQRYPEPNVQLKLEDHNTYLTNQYVTDIKDYIPELMANPDIEREDKKAYIKQYMEMINSPTKHEELDQKIDELQKAQYIKNIANFPALTTEDAIDQFNISTNLFTSMSDAEVAKELDEDYNTFTEDILPFFRNTNIFGSKNYALQLENLANPWGVTELMKEGFQGFDSTLEKKLYDGVDFLNNKLDKDGSINWNASLARIAYEPIAFADFLLSIPAFLARGLVDEIIPSLKGLAFPEQWERIKKERLLEQLKPTDQVGFWRKLSRGLDLIPIEQHLRSWIKNRTAISDEEKEEYLMRMDNTLTDQGLKGLEWGVDSLAEIMDATGFSDSKSKAKSQILSVLVYFGLRGIGKRAAVRLERTNFVQNWAARARKRRRDKEAALAARALTDLNKKIKVKTVGPEAPKFTMKKEKRGKYDGPITDADIIDFSVATGFKYTGLGVKPGSPIDITVRANPQFGSIIAEAILKEAKDGNKAGNTAATAAEFFRTTPNQLLNSYYYNPLEIGENLTSSITLYHKIADMVDPIKKILDSQFIHPVVYTIPDRKEKMDAIEKVLTELAPRQYHQEISGIGFTPLTLHEGTGLTSNVINIAANYGKNENTLIYTVDEAIAGYEYVYEAASKQFDNPIVWIEEHRVDAINLKHTIEEFKKKDYNYVEGNPLTIRWDYRTVFDPLANSIYGPQSMLPETTYYGIPAGRLQRYGFAGSWLSRNALVPSWYSTADLYNRNQVQRATKAFNTILNKIVKFHPDKLFDIINKGHRENRELGWKEVITMFRGTNIYSDGLALEKLYGNYKTFRALNDLAYNISNKALREAMVKAEIELGLWRTADISKGEAYDYLEGVSLDFTLPRYILEVQQKAKVNEQATPDFFNKTEVTEDVVADNPNLRVWEYETNTIVDFLYSKTRTTKNTEGVVIKTEYIDINGKTLVKLYRPKSMDLGGGIKSIANYALIDPTKYKLRPLPSKVLPYHEGQVHIVHTDPYFITLTPTELIIDGIKRNTKAVTNSKNNNEYYDQKEINKYTEVLHKAGSVKIAKQIIEKIKDDFEGYTVSYKKAAESPTDLLEVTDNYAISVSSTKQRSNHMMARDLESHNIMDPVQALVQSYSNAVKANLTTPVENQLLALWEDPILGMPEFLIDGKIPESLDKFKDEFKGSVDEGNRMAYDAAHQLLIYRELMRSKETFTEQMITETLPLIKEPLLGTMEFLDNAIMDLIRMSSKGAVRTLSPATVKAIEISNAITGKSVVNVANAAVSTVYIALNALRQPFVQNTQLFTYLIMNPHRAVQQIAQLIAIGLRLTLSNLPKSAMDSPTGMAARDVSNYMIYKLGEVPGFREEFKYFEEGFKGLEASGVLQTIDMNLMVEAMTSSIVGTKLKPTELEKLSGLATAIPKFTVSFVQQSFNISEGMQRIFFYMRAQEILLNKLPKDKRLPALKSDTFIADVTKAGFDFAGSQAESGKFNYQRGITGVIAKFAAIMQKITNNVAQGGKITFDKNGRILRESGAATIWNAGERARFGLAQAVAYGKWGIPIVGYLFYYYIDGLNEDDFEGEAKKILTYLKDPKTKALLENGIFNPIATFILNNGYVENQEWYKEKIAIYEAQLANKEITQEEFNYFKEGMDQNLNFSASVSPTGSTGQPYVPITIIISALEAMNLKESTFNQGGFRFPLIQMLEGNATSLMRLQLYFALKELSDEDMIDAFPRILAPSLSAFNNFLKAKFAKYYGDLYTKSGQPLHLNIENPKLAIAMAFGFQPESTAAYFDVLKRLPNNVKAYKDLAKQFYDAYAITELDQKTEGITLSTIERLTIQAMIIEVAASEFPESKSEARYYINREFKKLDKRKNKLSGEPSLIDRIKEQAYNTDLPYKELNRLKADLLKLRTGAIPGTRVEINAALDSLEAAINLRRRTDTKQPNKKED